jgi:hypothetical protein
VESVKGDVEKVKETQESIQAAATDSRGPSDESLGIIKHMHH